MSGAISIAAGLSIAELAASMPRVGGTYVYLREAGGTLITVGILVSVFGTLNGVIMTAPRYYYAMARDNLFFASKVVGAVHPQHKTPHVSLVISALWSIVLILTGSFGQLLGLVVFVAWIFYLLSIGVLFILRKKRPDLHRPYKVIGYPVVPIIGVLGGSGF